MSQRTDFVRAARAESANVSALCRQFGISRKTGYKWLARYAAEGVEGLAAQSRRPHRSPAQTETALEVRVVAARLAHPAWGARKLRQWLVRQGQTDWPAVSTLHAILQRYGLIAPEEGAKHRPYQRFERSAPNELWQMDFKGPVVLGNGSLCHPLTVLDDHSRFLLGLVAAPDQRRVTVQPHLTALFRAYGLPEAMLMDNGGPWATTGASRWTRLTVWLLRLGIRVAHGRPYHPQTQGKDERLHRTLQAELLGQADWYDLFDCQAALDPWRACYNRERPHQALDGAVPAERYQPSSRPFPERLPSLVYADGDLLRKVESNGTVWLEGQRYKVGKAFAGQHVALRPDPLVDGQWQVVYAATVVRTLKRHGLPLS